MLAILAIHPLKPKEASLTIYEGDGHGSGWTFALVVVVA